MMDEKIFVFGEIARCACMVGHAGQDHIPVIPSRLVAIKNMRTTLDQYPVPEMSEALAAVDPADGASMIQFFEMVMQAIAASAEPGECLAIAKYLNDCREVLETANWPSEISREVH